MGGLQKTLFVATALSAIVAGANGKPKSQIDLEHTICIAVAHNTLQAF